MINAERLLGKMVKQSLKKGLRGNRSLVSAIPGGWKSVAGLGAIGVAIAAFDHFTQKNQNTSTNTPQSYPPTETGGEFRSASPPPPPPPTPPDAGFSESTPGDAQLQERSILLIRVMIAAANADGNVDSEERNKILSRLREAGVTAEEERFIVQELESPPSIDSLLPSINNPDLAADAYLVSLLTIEIDSKAERDYLAYLRSRLDLEDTKVREIHQSLNIEI
jgi:uncharacterized membrane protein YebE (DUF533 family)